MHVFVFHSVEFLKKYGSLLPLSMEGVELMNRKNKCVFRGGTDHGREDGVSDQVLFACKYITCVSNTVEVRGNVAEKSMKWNNIWPLGEL